ncbi:MAG: radical SAM protein [Syntrophales bacterium]|nr:radical SAM protein [Syntrophales bacterium]
MTRLRQLFSLGAIFIRRRVLQQNIPLLASFKLTYQCNLTCLACPFHLRGLEEKAHMSWHAAAATLDEIRRRGARIVVFEGGEPFLWQDGRYDLNDLINYAKKLFMCVAVTTNGTFLLNTPADILWVSLDGQRECHNRLRSQSFDRVWSNLQMAKHGRLMIHFTINRENRRDIRPLLENLVKMPVVRGMTVQFFYPYNQGEAPLSLTAEERRETIEEVVRLKRQGFPILNSVSRLTAMINNTWRCHDDILINVDPDGTITSGCYVKNRGDINCRACGFTPVAEASGALDLRPGSIRSGWSIFFR